MSDDGDLEPVCEAVDTSCDDRVLRDGTMLMSPSS
jgi:hypothetical protein